MPSLHNARADKVATAPSWRGPFAKRRAVIPATGYYEWLPSEDADGKPFNQPYYIHPANRTGHGLFLDGGRSWAASRNNRDVIGTYPELRARVGRVSAPVAATHR